MYLMAKDEPVLKIEDGKCQVLRLELLPFSIRKEHVSLEDFYGNWMNERAIQLSRTNSKMILNSLRVSQTNAYAICKACHGLSLTDMYWFKDEEDKITWSDINLFKNDISKGMASTALVGDALKEKGKIHTPELTTQGVTAKAWVKDSGKTYLYKIGRKELAASAILDTLGFNHVKYEKVTGEELDKVVTVQRKEQIEALGEEVVKCELIASEDRSMVNFEDYQLYCENHGKNVYDETFALDRKHYLEMQIADYVLNNIDRHAANWGYFMDNSSGEVLSLYPLLDHDHAFSDVEGMMSQTTEQSMDLSTAALLAQSELHADLPGLLLMECPDGLDDTEWESVQRRAISLHENCRIYENILATGYQPTWDLIENIRLLERASGTEVTLTEIIAKNNAGIECSGEERAIIEGLREQVIEEDMLQYIEEEV